MIVWLGIGRIRRTIRVIVASGGRWCRTKSFLVHTVSTMPITYDVKKIYDKE